MGPTQYLSCYKLKRRGFAIVDRSPNVCIAIGCPKIRNDENGYRCGGEKKKGGRKV